MLRPQECCGSQSGADFGRTTLGGLLDFLEISTVSTDLGTVSGHEIGHALYLMKLGSGKTPNPADSNDSALKLENAVRRARDPKAPVRINHP